MLARDYAWRARPPVGRTGTKLDRSRPTLARFGPQLRCLPLQHSFRVWGRAQPPKLAEPCPDLGRAEPDFTRGVVKARPTLQPSRSQVLLSRARICSTRAQTRATQAQICPNTSQAEIGRTKPNFGRSRPRLDARIPSVNEHADDLLHELLGGLSRFERRNLGKDLGCQVRHPKRGVGTRQATVAMAAKQSSPRDCCSVLVGAEHNTVAHKARQHRWVPKHCEG